MFVPINVIKHMRGQSQNLTINLFIRGCKVKIQKIIYIWSQLMEKLVSIKLFIVFGDRELNNP